MSNEAKFVRYEAAGGVVVDFEEAEVLVLVRPSRDEVRLPKGHVNPGEPHVQAALREVAEEGGYDDLSVLADLGTQRVVFPWPQEPHPTIRRDEHYFLMWLRSRRQTSRPPKDEAQFFPVWAPWEEAMAELTYEAEREWLRRARQVMDEKDKVLAVYRRLVRAYGEPLLRPSQQPLATLINTILSQNTNDRNRDLAFRRLRERFPTWEAVRDAPPQAVMEAIRPAGLAASKGPRIQAVLRRITEEQGHLSLDFLRTLPLEEARAWLTSLHGVGPKTAAIVLLFALGRPAFPVDTHVHRVSGRLGLIPPRTSRERAHRMLEELIPPLLYYPYHVNLITHGRQRCGARTPRCEACPLQDLCDFYATSQESSDGP